MKPCIYKLYAGFCCLLKDCKCIQFNPFKYVGK